MTLAKRTPLHTAKFRRQHPAARAFHAPQRPHLAPVQHPKPQCGMCGGKIHTRTDYRAPDEIGTRAPGWWLCESCDTGPEVGMPRTA